MQERRDSSLRVDQLVTRVQVGFELLSATVTSPLRLASSISSRIRRDARVERAHPRHPPTTTSRRKLTPDPSTPIDDRRAEPHESAHD